MSNKKNRHEKTVVNPEKLTTLLNQRYGIACTVDDMKAIIAETSQPAPKKETNSLASLTKITALVREQLGLSKKMSITMDKSLIADLGADELDIIELMMMSEERFQVELDEDNIQTVSDLAASVRMQQYLKHHPDKNLTPPQIELMTSLVSACMQCPTGTAMEYSAKKSMMRKLEAAGLVRIQNVRGDMFEVKVVDTDLIRP